ncbi:hypothetical protein Ri1_05990 [Aeromonas dhakensis]|nr:hypothetical protein Ri1_05990 [Aeromonas dhakensis]
MNNCRPGIEPAITGPGGGGRRLWLGSLSASLRGGRWRLPAPRLGLVSKRLPAALAFALGSLAADSGASVKVDYDVMYTLVGVDWYPLNPYMRVLTYRAARLDPSQRAFLEATPGRLKVWQKYSDTPGGVPTAVYFTDPPGYELSSISEWNLAVSGDPRPNDGAMVARPSEWTYDEGGRYGTESCVGFASGDGSPVSDLRVLPGTACPKTPDRPPTCGLSVTDVIDLGYLAPGQTGRGNGIITAECKGDWASRVTLGPVFLATDDASLRGLLGDGGCNDLKPTETFTVASGSSASRCLQVEGSFATTGSKRIDGVVVVSFS